MFIYRKKEEIYYSIEKIFEDVAKEIKKNTCIEEIYAPHSRLSPWNIIRNLLFVHRIKSDIYHITGDIHYLAIGLSKSKTALTIHDCVFLHQTTGVKKFLLKKLFLDWPVNHLKYITTISEKTKEEIISYTGCPADKIIVIPNPVSNTLYYIEKSFNKERPQILFIGSTPNKNLKRVIAALKDISCFLRIIGKISKEQRQLLTDNAINFSETSGISEQQLNEEYHKSDIVLFPSLYEGFGLPIIEGHKTGRVVITSTIAPMDSVAGEAAHLVDPYSAASIREGILKVIQDDNYRNNLIQKGFENVERFSPQKIADQYLELYKQIASKN